MKTMNIILSAINTKHTHSALALACLKSYWDIKSNVPLKIKEFDLNILNETIINELILLKPDVIAFSTYIWSKDRIIAVSSAIKAVNPDCVIILGGPEVSYNSLEVMQQHKSIDFIINGEGEITFYELLTAILNSEDVSEIRGITFRKNDEVLKTKFRPFVQDLDILPSPFTTGNYKGTASFTYYEASRGCPSKCAYCLSSIQGNVRNHSLERVKTDLDWFFKSDFDQIRFADRTFNFDSPRAREIISYIKQHNVKCKNFHFEIQADFLSDEIIELLSDAPRGMFHLEIGIQSTNAKALSAVHRRFDLENLKKKIALLRQKTKCYLHLDVLGGLPFDTYLDFCKSLDDVARMEPEDIQISLVKILHGTPYEYYAKDGHIFYMSEPPYTVLRTDWLKPEEAVMISQISKLAEGIVNTGRFNATLKALRENFFEDSLSKLLESMVYYWRQEKLLFYNFSPENTVKHLTSFIEFSIKEKNKSKFLLALLNHELRLTLKSPNSDFYSGPEFENVLKKPEYKLAAGIKVYWYEVNPLSNFTLNIDTPIAYEFSHSDSGSPIVKLMDFTFEECFVLGAVQKKVNSRSLVAEWERLYPNLETPDLDKILSNLRERNIVLFSTQTLSKGIRDC